MYQEEAVSQHLTAEAIPVLTAMRDSLAALTTWDKESLHGVIVQVTEASGVKMGKVAQPVRVAVTGSTMSPPIDVTLQLLGRERSLERLGAALALCAKAT